MHYFLSLGGNLGDRLAFLGQCRDLLEHAAIRILRCSRVYETEPVGYAEQLKATTLAREVTQDSRPGDKKQQRLPTKNSA